MVKECQRMSNMCWCWYVLTPCHVVSISQLCSLTCWSSSKVVACSAQRPLNWAGAMVLIALVRDAHTTLSPASKIVRLDSSRIHILHLCPRPSLWSLFVPSSSQNAVTSASEQERDNAMVCIAKENTVSGCVPHSSTIILHHSTTGIPSPPAHGSFGSESPSPSWPAFTNAVKAKQDKQVSWRSWSERGEFSMQLWWSQCDHTILDHFRLSFAGYLADTSCNSGRRVSAWVLGVDTEGISTFGALPRLKTALLVVYGVIHRCLPRHLCNPAREYHSGGPYLSYLSFIHIHVHLITFPLAFPAPSGKSKARPSRRQAKLHHLQRYPGCKSSGSTSQMAPSMLHPWGMLGILPQMNQSWWTTSCETWEKPGRSG